jgi:hypothetical protein
VIVPGVTDVFVENFYEFSGGYWPMYTASGAYEAIYMIKEAIEGAGTTDPNTSLPVIQNTERTCVAGQFKFAQNDVFCDSTGINWTQYDDEPYGYTRSEMVQWIQNTTTPAPPEPNVGAQMNVVSPLLLVPDNTNPSYSRKTQIPPNMYPLATWDINFDGKIDMKDIATTASAFGSTPGQPRYNLEADINTDGKIDMKDVGGVAKHFGQMQNEWPMDC